MVVLILRSHTAQVLFELNQTANQVSETIKSATHDDMLENRREDLHRQIRNIGELKREGIQKVRLFNKEGRIMFSSDREEIGKALDKRGEACYACHAEGQPLEKLDIQSRARIFRAADGSRILGIINPIPNEPSCWTADCHAHPREQKVLGVLDVNLSMVQADGQIRASRDLLLGLAALAIAASSLIIWYLNGRLVLRPVAALLEGTRRVAEGDLNTPIPVTARHELGKLAAAFNAMTQRQLTQADKLASVGRLAAGVAHEINNPLTGVLTYASLLAKRCAGDPQTLEDLEVIVRETKRCRGIIRELLDFARPTAPARKPTDLNEVVRRALAVVTNQFHEHRVELVLDLAEALPEAFADGNQIQQVVVNLLLNAADAIGPDGGQIHIATAELPAAGGGHRIGHPARGPAAYLRTLLQQQGQPGHRARARGNLGHHCQPPRHHPGPE
jgi:two-component system NtrC family sensor kinase